MIIDVIWIFFPSKSFKNRHVSSVEIKKKSKVVIAKWHKQRERRKIQSTNRSLPTSVLCVFAVDPDATPMTFYNGKKWQIKHTKWHIYDYIHLLFRETRKLNRGESLPATANIIPCTNYDKMWMYCERKINTNVVLLIQGKKVDDTALLDSLYSISHIFVYFSSIFMWKNSFWK